MVEVVAADTQAAVLCKACGLCCTGRLFAWTKLRSAEMDAIQELGVKVFREPHRRGFDQPCPLWDGVCTIYASPRYPNFCRVYKCRLLKRLLDGRVGLTGALAIVRQTKNMIAVLEKTLPPSANPNFRERLVAHLEESDPSPAFIQGAEALFEMYRAQFGVTDLPGPL